MFRLLTAILIACALACPEARAETPVPLGPGTACVMMREAEAKRMLGLRKRHVLACADRHGKVVRVVLTRKGIVECVDAVQVAGDGSTATVGTPCKGLTSSAQSTVPPVVNVEGAWHTEVDSLIGLVVCTTQVVQNADRIEISATCDLGAAFQGNGLVTFDGLTFTATGPAEVPYYGHCGSGRMDAAVSPDGQSVTGTLTCDSLTVPFRSTRL